MSKLVWDEPGGQAEPMAWQERDVYVLVKAYYKPNSGEFLFYSSIIRQQEEPPRNLNGSRWSCEPSDRTVALLEDGEWVEFWSTTSSPRLEVFHSKLRFSSIREAWRYVSAHFENCQVSEGKDKCHTEIPLYKDLDFDFFRPERLRFTAAPYAYNPLVSARKVSSTWEVVIKGANEPSRAMVLLDESFKLLNIRKFSASQ